MSKTKHLDRAIAILTAPAPHSTRRNMRGDYETALAQRGWTKQQVTAFTSEWRKGQKRMLVEDGDRVSIKMHYLEINWRSLNPTARKRLLLHSQGKLG